MNRVFEIQLEKRDAPDIGAHATLSLPATPYELLDSMDKLRLQLSEEIYCEVYTFHDFEYLAPFFDDGSNLYELNALAKQLSELKPGQRIAFEGLVMVEISKKDGPVSISRLIDLAYSTDCCHVVDTVHSDAQLGRFYAENGFIPELDKLSDEVFRHLDFESIGRRLRIEECGVHTPHGYVTQHSDLNEVFDTLDLTLKKPDYQILLEVSKGYFNEPNDDSDRNIQLKLPADDRTLDGMLAALDVDSLDECGFRCLDCRMPALITSIDGCDLEDINHFAERLAAMGDKALLTYKAAVSSTEDISFQAAITLADHIDLFMLDSTISSPQELAIAELGYLLDDNDLEKLQKHVDLYGYGQTLLAQDNAVISPYGHLARDDFEPIQAPLDTLKQEGIEMA